MNANELRHRVTAVLLQAGEPLTLPELRDATTVTERRLRRALGALVADALVVEGELADDKPAPQYRWAARWHDQVRRRAGATRDGLLATMSRLADVHGREIDIEGDPATTFHRYIMRDYVPPQGKPFLVFLQCSVRRPFSSSPSHAAMRRAISVATGYDPRHDFDRCPVHVVVLASKVGPVPYELEDVYPANVGGAGVKQFSRADYERIKPILAGRMAGYLIAHGGHYKRIATFTEGRYAEVMVAARQASQAEITILPVSVGPRVVRMGASKPRKYWEKYWVQLCLLLIGWLAPGAATEAEARLQALDVECEGSDGQGQR